MLVIEHDMPLLSSICDDMMALELGRVIARGTQRGVFERPRLIDSYFDSEETGSRR